MDRVSHAHAEQIAVLCPFERDAVNRIIIMIKRFPLTTTMFHRHTRHPSGERSPLVNRDSVRISRLDSGSRTTAVAIFLTIIRPIESLNESHRPRFQIVQPR